MNIRFLTAGESHGKALVGIIEGLPSGLSLEESAINGELKRRMKGYGRGGRMKIESDKAKLLSGTRHGKTLGTPVAILIENKDFKIEKLHSINSPRPGHADLAGALKFGEKDIRNILERASARETAARVAIGAACRALLSEFAIDAAGHVLSIGEICSAPPSDFNKIKEFSEKSPVRCADKNSGKKMRDEIDKAGASGDTLGGTFEVRIKNVPPGLGSYSQWDKRMDAILAMAFMSIPGVKAVEIGAGTRSGSTRGSFLHDEIFFNKRSGKIIRKTNNAGGIEGGITNGEEIVIRATMKPIATLRTPLSSINLNTKAPKKAQVERADVCVVPACCVIGENISSIEIAKAMIEKFGGDSLTEMKRNYNGYMKSVKKF